MKLQSEEYVSPRPKVLAIIPARGGSKGLPRKNIKDLCGKPLIAWTIEAAKECFYIDKVIVSTEDSEIADVARQYEAEVIDRPVELAKDDTLIQPVMEQVLDKLEENGFIPDVVILLNPTSPLRTSEDIIKAMYHFICGQNDSLISVYQKVSCVWTLENGGFKANYDFIHKGRRQDMPKQYRESGAIYICKTALLRKTHHFMGGNMAVFPMLESHSIDIDSELDFIIAKAVMDAYIAYQSEVKGS